MSFSQELKEICQKALNEKDRLRTINSDSAKCNLFKWFNTKTFKETLLVAAKQGQSKITVNLGLQEFNTMNLKECPGTEFIEVFEQMYPGLTVWQSMLFDCSFYINIL